MPVGKNDADDCQSFFFVPFKLRKETEEPVMTIWSVHQGNLLNNGLAMQLRRKM